MTEKIHVFKLYEEISDKMKTFHTEKEMFDFVELKKVESPVYIKLELDEVFDDGAYINIMPKVDGYYNYSATIHINRSKTIPTYSWTEDFHNGSRDFKTANECLKDWFNSENEEQEYNVNCSNCGDGGCVHCEPHRFLQY